MQGKSNNYVLYARKEDTYLITFGDQSQRLGVAVVISGINDTPTQGTEGHGQDTQGQVNPHGPRKIK